MNNFQIFGILGLEKDGKKVYRIYLGGEFSEYSQAHSFQCDGVEVISEYTTLDCSKLAVGDLVQVFYTRGYEGKARLVGIEKVATK